MRLIDLDEFLRQNCVDRMEGKSCEECKHHVLEVSCERLMEQPTIDPVKHGRWVMQGTAYGCSLCGEGVIHPFHNYCQNCGARMVEGEEDETD